MTTTPTFHSWVTFPQPRPEADLRLFCFPYAGGSSLIFRAWSNGCFLISAEPKTFRTYATGTLNLVCSSALALKTALKRYYEPQRPDAALALLRASKT
jgi:surfactin synthase thioesterase subunit